MPASSTPTVVIFGASGDLTARKLIPALFNLYCKDRLPAGTRIVGFARRPYDHDKFRSLLRDSTQQFARDSFDEERWETFAQQLWYARGDLDNANDFAQLDAQLRELEDGDADRLYYLATAPSYYTTIVENLAAAGMNGEETGWRRIIIEKPFGRDLASAQTLNQHVHAAFAEQQVYRIDHYLGKETAQNIMFFRFSNTVFETVWNRNYIDHVQITVAEEVDVGSRAGYYDHSGVLRDMFQNHLLQVLALVAMEPPASFSADAVRNEVVKVLSAVRPLTADDLAENTVRAQYAGYRDADGVDSASQTPTYAALRLHIDNWRWQGVPFYLRSGKALPEKTSEVTIQFRCPPHLMFPLPPGRGITPDVLSLCLQPDEGIHFRFEAKVPDTVSELRTVDMAFHYEDTFGKRSIPEAYERLILDAIMGDATLFIRSDAIEQAWTLIDPVLQGWEQAAAPPLALYEPGSWGPDEADALLNRDGRGWRHHCGQHD